jgi:CRISPR type III-A-associated protein Csm2
MSKFEKKWIESPDGIPMEAIKWAEDFGKELAAREKDTQGLTQLTSTQLRRFFGKLKRLQAVGFNPKTRNQLIMLKPHLAYAVGRDKKNGRSQSRIVRFYTELSSAIDALYEKTEQSSIDALYSKLNDSDKQAISKETFKDNVYRDFYKNFINLVEAVVAYHKYQEGTL